MLFLAGFGIQAVAAGADIQWTPKTVKGGFTVKVPGIDNDVLVGEIAALKIELMQDEKLLSQKMEQKRFKKKDTVLATLLPGGLLYAAIKKNAHRQAVQDHKLVTSRLKEITTDLAAFTAIDGPVELAQVQ
jgi:hypothetical protein